MHILKTIGMKTGKSTYLKISIFYNLSLTDQKLHNTPECSYFIGYPAFRIIG